MDFLHTHPHLHHSRDDHEMIGESSSSSSSRSGGKKAASYPRDYQHEDTSRMLWPRQCVSCDNTTPSCNCAADETCVLTSRTCSQCASIQCNKKSGGGGGGINPGVIAGPIVAVLVIASLGLFWWLRRKKRRDLARVEELAVRARKAESAGFHLSQPGSPAPGSARSGAPPLSAKSTNTTRRSQLPPPPPSANPRRTSHQNFGTTGSSGSGSRSPLPPAPYSEYKDEGGQVYRIYHGNGTINADPNHPENGGLDPFGDGHSVSTGKSDGTGASTNIIPIQYIPSSRSDGSLARSAGGSDHIHSPTGSGHNATQSAAARALDEARQNLWRPKQPPTRPARAPGLDLRAPENGGGGHHLGVPQPERSPAFSNHSQHIRDSYLSENSGAPSFLSGVTSSDVYTDAPRIMTSKQVQIGRFQQAEVVTWGKDGKPILDGPPSTSGHGHGGYGDEDGGDEPSSAGSGDLRFSMGSLAYRDSFSTIGTNKYLARSESGYQGPGIPPPRSLHPPNHQPLGSQPRESVISSKSYADSVLSGFPMIPPNGSNPPSLPASAIPQSSSAATLLSTNGGGPMISRPPPAYKPLQNVSTARQRSPVGTGPPPTRPETTASVADSFLGSFPFVPPNMEDLAALPSAAGPSAGGTNHSQSRNGGDEEHMHDDDDNDEESDESGKKKEDRGKAMSTYSEGLGGFEFQIDERAPPVPGSQSGHGHGLGK